MKPISARDPFKTGLAALAGVVLLGLVVVLLSVVSFGTHSYTAVVAQSAGLVKGEDVDVHGVVEGKVTDVDLVGSDVVVHFTLKKSVSLGEDTTASIKVATLLGTHYLEVDPAGSGSLANDQIDQHHTSVPYNLQDVLNTGTTRLEQLHPVELAKALTTVARTLDASSPDIGPALQGVGRLSQLVTDRQDQTTALLKAARNVTDQLSSSSLDLVALMKQTNLVVDEVTARRTAIRRILVQTQLLAHALDDIVNKTDADLTPALRNINLALASLDRQRKSLQHVLVVMEPAVRYIANATGNGPFADLFTSPPGLESDNEFCKTSASC